METREAYHQKYEAQLKEWSAKVDVLKAQADKATAQAKIDMAPRISAFQDKLTHARTKLSSIAAATDDKWDDIKKDADDAWHDLKSSVEGAFAALHSHKKD
jgi:hypothetical protein